MSIRHSLATSILLALVGPVACGSADEAPAKSENAVMAAPPPSDVPSMSSATPGAALPPITEAAPPATADAGATTPAPSGSDVDSGSPTPPGTQIDPNPGCAGGEPEVEPNTLASPNVLTTMRCGVLEPGDSVDVLLVSKQAFKLGWSGFVNAELEATAGGYLVKITSQTPSVATPWEMHFE